MTVYISRMDMKHPNLIGTVRRQRGLSQVQLAARIEMNPSYLARMERGEMRPRLDTARRIAAALSTHVDDLWPMDANAAA